MEAFILSRYSGSPYKFHVDSIASGSVTAYGPGLTHGTTGDPCNFIISTKGAGAGGLSLAVDGPSKAEVIFFVNLIGARDEIIVRYLAKNRFRTVTTKTEP